MDLNETLGRVDPVTLAFAGGIAGGLARELVRWRTLAVAGTAAIFAQPVFLAFAGVEVMLGGGVATLAHSYTPTLAPPLALLASFLLGATDNLGKIQLIPDSFALRQKCEPCVLSSAGQLFYFS